MNSRESLSGALKNSSFEESLKCNLRKTFRSKIPSKTSQFDSFLSAVTLHNRKLTRRAKKQFFELCESTQQDSLNMFSELCITTESYHNSFFDNLISRSTNDPTIRQTSEYVSEREINNFPNPADDKYKKKCYHKNPIEWLSLISRKKKVCLSVCLFLFTQLMNNEFGYPWLPMKNTKFSTNSIVSSRFLAHNKSRRRQHCALSEQMHNLSASANALVECRR